MKRTPIAVALCLTVALSSCPAALASTGNYQLSINSAGTALKVNADDLFAHASQVAPGSSVTSTLTVVNHSSSTFEVFFKPAVSAKIRSSQTRSAELLKSITLHISNASTGKSIYVGPLSGKSSSSSTSLGTFSADKRKRLTFKLDVPASLGNDYTEALSSVKWKFTAQEEQASQPVQTTAGSKLPQTGSSLVPLIVLAAVSFAGALAAAIADSRRSRKSTKRGRSVY